MSVWADRSLPGLTSDTGAAVHLVDFTLWSRRNEDLGSGFRRGPALISIRRPLEVMFTPLDAKEDV